MLLVGLAVYPRPGCKPAAWVLVFMNALYNLHQQAGQKAHEKYFGATMAIFQADAINPLADPIPCIHTHPRADFVFGPAGKSDTTAIESITFRADQCGGNFPVKGTRFILYPANGAQPLEMQLWDGGLLPNGLIYQFM